MHMVYTVTLLGGFLVSLASAASVFSMTGGESVCQATRGYTPKAAQAAAYDLAHTYIPKDGYHMAQDYCVYQRHKMTIAAMCNTASRNRTVTQGEVQRALNQLKDDCGNNWFSGYHTVNELVVAVYGVQGGSMSPPDVTLPGTGPGIGRRDAKKALATEEKYKRQLHESLKKAANIIRKALNVKTEASALRKRNSCDGAPPNNVEHTDCGKFSMDGDGNCPVNEGGACRSYCEVRRKYFLGRDIHFQNEGSSCGIGLECQFQTSWEVTVTQGFSVDASLTDTEGIFSGGLSYQYEVSKTHGTATTTTGNAKEGFRGAWVFIPEMIESCGTISTRDYGSFWNGVSVVPQCQGAYKTFVNQCTISANLDSNKQAKGITLMSKLTIIPILE